MKRERQAARHGVYSYSLSSAVLIVNVAGVIKLQAGPEDDKNGRNCGLELSR